MDGPMHRTKLTRKFYQGVAPGKFLVSNTFKSSSEPWFSEYVTLDEHKADQWSRIKRVSADQRLCMVFDDEQCFRDWFNKKYD